MACLDYTPSQDLTIKLGNCYLADWKWKAYKKRGKWEILYNKQVSFCSLLTRVDSDPTFFLFLDAF